MPGPVGGEALPEGARRFISFMETRYACKRFDPSRPPARSLVDYLVECVRLSPSAFGLEHTRLIAALGSELRSALALASGGQEAVASAPLILLFLVPRASAYALDSDYIRGRASRFPGGMAAFRADYEGYYDFLIGEGRLEGWARAQSYIALANAMTGAAAAGLDSCAIEGFDEEMALSAVGLDAEEWMACLMCAFGYRDEERRERFRLESGEMSQIL
jgi:nitroreductase